MNCPNCSHNLKPAQYEHLPYHYCTQCEGIWVNTKMLKHLAARIAADTNIKSSKPVPLLHKTVATVPQDDRIRLCPQCTAGMKIINYAYDSNVIIDRCDACDGIWLDEGEIIKLAQFHQVDENTIRAGRALMDIHKLPEKTAKQAEYIADVLKVLMWLFP
jgi:Zn-finger nucleic acid-binding protein